MFLAMNRFLSGVLVVSTSVLGAQSLPPATSKGVPPVKDVRNYIFVEPSTKRIEEKTLALNAGLQARQNAGSMRMGRGRDDMADMDAEMPNGANYYVFKLQPKEKLRLDLKCELSGEVWMQFVKPPHGDAMASAFRRANMPPKAVRSRRIAIQNITSQGYEVVMAVYGSVNHSFSLDIERQVE